MDLSLKSNNISDYLEPSEIIDYNSEEIKEIVKKIKRESTSTMETIKNAYEFVRDNISHSADINGKVVTCNASEVLKAKEGICYAKSHLLAAILRSLNIPTGFCYQKLVLEDDIKPWLIIHGLNAVYVEELNKWIRLDARGNKDGVNAEFSIDEEKLAFPIREELGEEDILVIYSKPDDNVIRALRSCNTVEELFDNLPTELADEIKNK